MEMTDAEQYRHVRRINEKHRYATNPEYREKCRERASAYYWANREKIAERWRQRCESDPSVREAARRRAREWASRKAQGESR